MPFLAPPQEKGPTSRRPFLFAPRQAHLAFLLAAAAAIPLMFAFAAGHGVATVGDDSVSYLVLARYFAGTAGTIVGAWVPHEAHFPPLFPLALAWSGAASDLRLAHALVAAFAALGLLAIYRYAARSLESDAAGLALVLLFLALPAAWIAMKGILSETLYLCLSLAALYWHGTRIADRPARTWEWLAFGVLLAAAVLTRAAGLALVAAYVASLGLRAARARHRPAFREVLPLAVVAATTGAWLALRPQPGEDAYRMVAGSVIEHWLRDPGLIASASARYLHDGWLAQFNIDNAMPWVPAAFLSALGIAAFAGALRRALTHRLDGWYAVIYLAVVFAWAIDDTRRFLYPVMPVLLVLALDAILAAARAAGIERHGAKLAATAGVLAAALCAPALFVVLDKSRDRQPMFAGASHSYAEITDYYTTVNVLQARAMAARQAAVLEGLEGLARATPVDAGVMWMRPDYVALLGGRRGEPYLYSWDGVRLAREIARTKTGYFVIASLFKADLAGDGGRQAALVPQLASYSTPVMTVGNAVTGEPEFVLMQIDPERLDRFLAAGRS